MNQFTPLPASIGIGFTAKEKLGENHGYDYRPLRGFHNYHVTPECWHWPEPYTADKPKVIDGFSPNLNKTLHCGHLKNLAVGAALANILEGKPVAMLGASLGILEGALDTYRAWCELAGYNPTLYLDNELPALEENLMTPGSGDYEGCTMLANSESPIVLIKSHGTPTYAYHDLAFAKTVHPDYYLTGAEQKPHFQALGLGDKHLALGLVLGSDGAKMRSRAGGENAVSADELFQMVLDCLKESPEPRKLAWNILAYQFNSSTVQANTKFNAEAWAKPEAPGMYVSYTYARITNALKGAKDIPILPPAPSELGPDDVELLGVCSYLTYATMRARKTLQPNVLANYALELSKKLSSLYKKKSIQEGGPGFLFAVATAQEVLGETMALLGMHRLAKV